MKKVLAFILAVLICTALSGCREKTLDEVWKEEFDKADGSNIDLKGGLIDYHLGGY